MTELRYTTPDLSQVLVALPASSELGGVRGPAIFTVIGLPNPRDPVAVAVSDLIRSGTAVAPFVPPVVATTIRVAKGDVWRRATDGEAAMIDAALQAQPLRLRNLFRDAAYLSSDDELWPDLYAGFVVAFGPSRAAELLAPSA